MKFFEKIQIYIRSLNQHNFKKNFIIFISVIAFIMISISYFIYKKSTSLIKQLDDIKHLTIQTNLISKRYQVVQNQKKYIQSLLEKEKDFEIKGFFEAFCKKHQIKSEDTWTTLTSSIEGNNQIEEVSLKATFKNQTSEKLVEILKDIEEKKIVYIKNLKIDKEKDKTISFDLTIATFKNKLIKN
jgi:hypothetical protein